MKKPTKPTASGFGIMSGWDGSDMTSCLFRSRISPRRARISSAEGYVRLRKHPRRTATSTSAIISNRHWGRAMRRGDPMPVVPP